MPLEQYLALPEEKPYLEWWDGIVLQKAVGNFDHGELQAWLAHLLTLYRLEAGGHTTTELHTWFESRGYRLPDVAYWAPGKPRIGARNYGLPPTLAVEIESPGNRPGELQAKCEQMSALGVDECWLVLPAERAVEVYNGGRRTSRLQAGAELRPQAMPGFAVSVAKLFSVLEDFTTRAR